MIRSRFTPAAPAIFIIIFALTVLDGAWRKDDDHPAFIDLIGTGTGVHILVAGGLAAFVAFIFLSAVHDVGGGGTWTTAAVLAVVLLAGYLARVHVVSTLASFFVLALASLLMFGLMAFGRQLGEAAGPAIPPQRAFHVLAASTAVVFPAAVALSLVTGKTNPAVSGVRPTEILVYLLFILIAMLVVAKPLTAYTGDSREPTPEEPWRLHSLGVAAVPAGLFMVISDLGASLVLAAGLFTVLLVRLLLSSSSASDDGERATPADGRRRELKAALAAMGFYGLVCVGWSMVSPTVDAYREAAGIAFDPDEAWRAARTAGAAWTGLGPGADGLSDNELGYELAVVTIVEQYGPVLTFLVLLTLCALIGLLAHSALRVRGTSAGAVALGLVAMLAASVLLPGIAMLFNVPLGVAVPLLSADATSFVLTLGAIGFVTGVGAGVRPTTEGSTADEHHASRDPLWPRYAHLTPGRWVPGRAREPRRGLVTVAIALPLCVLAYIAVPIRVLEATTYNVKATDGTLLAYATERDGIVTVDHRLPAGFVPAVTAAPGDPTITVTLDPMTQARAIQALGGHDGAVVVLDTASGAVRAATHRGTAWEPTSAKPAPGLGGLVTIAGSPATPVTRSPETEACKGPVINALLTNAQPCVNRINTLANTSASTLAKFACSFPFANHRLPFGEIKIDASSFIRPDLCTYSPEERQRLLNRAPVSLTITPLEATGLAAFLAAGPASAPTRACPHFRTPAPDFCFEQDLPVDKTVILKIQEAMKNEEPENSPVALAVFEDDKTTWAIGHTPTTNPTKVAVVVLDPEVSRDEAERIAVAAALGAA